VRGLIVCLVLLGAAVGCATVGDLDSDISAFNADVRRLKERTADFEKRFSAFWQGLSVEQMAWLTIASEETSADATAGLVDALAPEQRDTLLSLAEEKKRLEVERRLLADERQELDRRAKDLEERQRGGLFAIRWVRTDGRR